MNLIKENDSILIGLLIGATIPLLGFFVIESVFELLTSKGIMDEVSNSSSGKRLRTMALVAICFNIIPLQFLKGRYYEGTIRGILLATFIYCGAWIAYFASALFNS